MGLLQAKVITSLGAQPEVVSVGHNPYSPSREYVDRHLVLPTTRPTASDAAGRPAGRRRCLLHPLLHARAGLLLPPAM